MYVLLADADAKAARSASVERVFFLELSNSLIILVFPPVVQNKTCRLF